MNKLVKGSIAGAAGIALLLGGAGTFALWNDAAAVDAGTVQTGTLDIDLIDGNGLTAGTGIWEDISPELAVANAFDPATDEIVPGDVVTFTQDVTVVASGKNLKAELEYVDGSIVIDPALLGDPLLTTDDYIDIDIDVTRTSGNATVTGPVAGVYTITPGASGTSEYEVVITVTFLASTPDQVGQTLSTGVDLTEASFSLTQVRP